MLKAVMNKVDQNNCFTIINISDQKESFEDLGSENPSSEEDPRSTKKLNMSRKRDKVKICKVFPRLR